MFTLSVVFDWFAVCRARGEVRENDWRTASPHQECKSNL